MFVDSHAHLHHLDLEPYQGDLSCVMKSAKDAKVQHILCVCIQPDELPVLQRIAQTYSNVSLSVGLHPNEMVEREPSEEDWVNWGRHPKIVALGETGLDYYRTEKAVDWQQERFRRHIRAARSLQKPLIVHTRHAPEDTLRILREEKADQVGGVLHCFTESFDMAQQAMDLGFYVSFSGIITFKNALEIQAVVKKVPLERLLIETDCPYLAPVPYRGKSNEPAYVQFVAEKVAALKQLPLEVVAQQTTRNFFDLFTMD